MEKPYNYEDDEWITDAEVVCDFCSRSAVGTTCVEGYIVDVDDKEFVEVAVCNECADFIFSFYREWTMIVAHVGLGFS